MTAALLKRGCEFNATAELGCLECLRIVSARDIVALEGLLWFRI